MLPDFAILTDLSEILAFLKAFFRKTEIYPTDLSIDSGSQLPRLPKKSKGSSEKWGGGIGKSWNEISFCSRKLNTL